MIAVFLDPGMKRNMVQKNKPSRSFLLKDATSSSNVVYDQSLVSIRLLSLFHCDPLTSLFLNAFPLIIRHD